MLIESENIKDWLRPFIKKNTIHFSCGDYIMMNGQPYYDMYKFIVQCEKEAEKDGNTS